MLSYAAKAVVAGLIAGLGTLGTALADGHVTALEGVGIATSVVLAAYGVFKIPNSDQDAGDHVDTGADDTARNQI